MASDELDFWSFVELARRRLRDEYGIADTDATQLLLSLNRASGVVTYDLEASAHRPRGRSWAVFRLMHVLWLTGPLESRKVAELCGMTRAGVTNLTKPLITEGVVERQPHHRDGRSVVLGLSADGQREAEEAFAAHHARERQWAAGLTTAEQHTLVRLLAKLIAHRPDLEVRGRR